MADHSLASELPAATPQHTFRYLWPVVFRLVDAAMRGRGTPRVFDLGCGAGTAAAALAARGYEVAGVDPSETEIKRANLAFPELRLEVGSGYDDLRARFGQFPVVISLEVIEHVYAPRDFARCLFELVEDGGSAVVSTPYHGYVKNLAMAITGKLESHFEPLNDGGHIKFWSTKPLETLFREVGFDRVDFYRAGRVAPLACSMIAVARKPARR